MKKNTKKIIAREFIILIVMLVLLGLVVSFTLIYHSYLKTNIDKISNKIENENQIIENKKKTIKKLTQIKIDNQKSFFKKFNDDAKLSGLFDNSSSLWFVLYRKAKNDSIKYHWNNEWKNEVSNVIKQYGYNTPKDFKNYLILNTLNKSDSLSLKTLEVNYKEIERLELEKYDVIIKDCDYDEEFLVSTLIILLSIFFLLRYLIYAIKWSFKTLKE